MSTKTLLKRIALVAVSALGAGLLSVAPSSALVSPDWEGSNFDLVSNSKCTDVSATGTLIVPVGSVMQLEVYYDGEDNSDVVVAGPLSVTSGTAQVGYAYNEDTDIVVGTNDLGQTTLKDNGDGFANVVATAVGTATIADATAAGRIDTSDDLTIKIVASCATNTFSAADSFISVTNDPSEDNAEDWYTEVYEDGVGNNDKQTYAQADGALYIRMIANNAYGDELPTGVWSASATNGATVAFGDTAYIPDADVEDAGSLSVAVTTTAGDGGLVSA